MKNLFKALSNFQEECPCILKDTQGCGYQFADLPSITKIINPILKKHGLGYSQPIQGDSLKTIIIHFESGEMIESIANIPQGVSLKGMNDFQILGSAITYLRRYSLSSILGIITDKDLDAAGEQVAKKPPISDDRFEKALIAISEGKATKDALLKFELTKSQNEQVKNL